ALVVYVAAAVRTLLEDREPGHAPEGGRAGHRDRSRETSVSLEDLAPEIRAEVEEVHRRTKRIERAIQYSEYPYAEVRTELAAFVNEAERSARAAQMLHGQ